MMLFEGCGGPSNPESGESWLRSAARGGDSGTRRRAGRPVRQGRQPAAGLWRGGLLVSNRRGTRCLTLKSFLGMLHLTGAGVARDVDEAISWFRRAAEAGDSRTGQFGKTYAGGNTPSTSGGSAASRARMVLKCSRAGRPGRGVQLCGLPRGGHSDCPAWISGAASTSKRASEGVADAQYWYGRMLAEGRGVVKDEAAAAI